VETGNLKGAIFNCSIYIAQYRAAAGSFNLIFPSIAPGLTPTPVVEELTIVHSGLVRTQ